VTRDLSPELREGVAVRLQRLLASEHWEAFLNEAEKAYPDPKVLAVLFLTGAPDEKEKAAANFLLSHFPDDLEMHESLPEWVASFNAIGLQYHNARELVGLKEVELLDLARQMTGLAANRDAQRTRVRELATGAVNLAAAGTLVSSEVLGRLGISENFTVPQAFGFLAGLYELRAPGNFTQRVVSNDLALQRQEITQLSLVERLRKLARSLAMAKDSAQAEAGKQLEQLFDALNALHKELKESPSFRDSELTSFIGALVNVERMTGWKFDHYWARMQERIRKTEQDGTVPR
jgi:hypothetical protein